jgi:GT2 family glycosyltransferase
VAAGLVDVEWYLVQSPTTPATPLAVAESYLRRGWRERLTPNPLFLAEWAVDPSGGGRLAVGGLVRRMAAEDCPRHPLFEPTRHLADHPEAADHPGGPLGHFLSTAAPGSPMPVREAVVGCPPWGRTRELLLATARRVAEERRPRLAEQASDWADEATTGPEDADGTRADDWPGVGVSVVISARDAGAGLATLCRRVADQELRSWELVVVDDRPDGAAYPLDVTEPAIPAARVRVVRSPADGEGAARSVAVQAAVGTYVAFLDPRCPWEPGYLRRATTLLADRGAAIGVCAFVRADAGGQVDGTESAEYSFRTFDDLLAGPDRLEMSTVLLDRRAVVDAGGFDATLPLHADWDLVLRLVAGGGPELLPVVGTRIARAAPAPSPTAGGWREHVLARHLIDWDEVAGRPRVAGRVSVLVPTLDDWRLTTRAVDAVRHNSEHPDLEIVVVDNGSRPLVRQLLAVLLTDRPGVRLERLPDNTNFALGSNFAFSRSTGQTVVFLNNDTSVTRGWLRPLLDELETPGTTAVQPLLLYPDGTVQCAGVVFPERPGLPVNFLVGHPPEDALALGTFPTFAVTGAAMMLRAETVLAAHGFDPLYSNGWEDVDLCLRMGSDGVRGTRVVTSSVVIHLESGGTSRLIAPHNRRLFLDRWKARLPRGPEPLWARAGFAVPHTVPDRPVPGQTDGSSRLARPLLVRAGSRAGDRLRWAIKIAAPAGAAGDVWGDANFATALAAALRRLGQTVVVDRREAHQRPSSYLDDVTLVLRGLTPFVVQPGRINLMWVISHPTMVTVDEVREYDLVFAASHGWSRRMQAESGVEVRPLLQATDPRLFNPERATPDTGYQAVFVGSSRNVERPVVRDAIQAGLDVAIFGPYWTQFFPDASFVHAAVPNAEVGGLYRAARVVLNDHWDDMAENGFVSNRLFDAVASGARVVSDPVDGIEELFEGAAQVYAGPEDLRRLAVDALDTRFPNEQQRVGIARRVAEKHSFDARATELLAAARLLREDG